MTKEIHTLLEKGAILRAKPTDPGYYSNLFIVLKKDGGSCPVINLKALNSHLSIPYFKMDGTQNLKDILTSRLHGQIGPTGCVPECSHVQGHVQISEDLLGGERLRVFGPPIQSRSSTYGFYKTNSILPQTTGNKDLGVFGRYAANGTISERSRDLRPDNNSVAPLSGVHPECGKMPDHFQSNDGVPGFSSRLTEHDSISSRIQSIEDQERMQAHEKPVSGDREAISSPNTSPDILLASNPSGTPTLTGTTASKEPGLGTGGTSYDRKTPMSKDAQQDLLWWIQQLSLQIARPILSPLSDMVLETDASMKGWERTTPRTGASNVRSQWKYVTCQDV